MRDRRDVRLMIKTQIINRTMIPGDNGSPRPPLVAAGGGAPVSVTPRACAIRAISWLTPANSPPP
jgi:hypothetical protein